jgi:hypothetical protein
MTRPSARPEILRRAHADAPPDLVGIVRRSGRHGRRLGAASLREGAPGAYSSIQYATGRLLRVRRALADDLEHKSKSGDLTKSEARRRLLLLAVSTTPTGLAHADLVIEAVPERADLKRRVLETPRSRGRTENHPFTSNTSSFPVARCAEWFPDPSRLIVFTSSIRSTSCLWSKSSAALRRRPRCERPRKQHSNSESPDRGRRCVAGFLVNRLFTPYLPAPPAPTSRPERR